NRVVIDAEPGWQGDVGREAAIGERPRRDRPDAIAQLGGDLRLGPLSQLALVRIWVEAGRGDQRVGRATRRDLTIELWATGRYPAVGGIVDVVPGPVATVLDRAEHIRQVVEILLSARVRYPAPDVHVRRGRSPVVRPDARQVGGLRWIRPRDVLGKGLCAASSQRNERHPPDNPEPRVVDRGLVP